MGLWQPLCKLRARLRLLPQWLSVMKNNPLLISVSCGSDKRKAILILATHIHFSHKANMNKFRSQSYISYLLVAVTNTCKNLFGLCLRREPIIAGQVWLLRSWR